jgi:hypothetical protein
MVKSFSARNFAACFAGRLAHPFPMAFRIHDSVVRGERDKR